MVTKWLLWILLFILFFFNGYQWFCSGSDYLPLYGISSIFLFLITDFVLLVTIFAYQTSCSRGQCSFLIVILIQLLRKCYYLQLKNTVLKPLSNLVQALHQISQMHNFHWTQQIQTNLYSEFHLSWTCSRLWNGYWTYNHAKTKYKFLQATYISKLILVYGLSDIFTPIALVQGFGFIFRIFFFKHNHTPSGKKTVTGMQVVTTSQVQIIGCRSKAIL